MLTKITITIDLKLFIKDRNFPHKQPFLTVTMKFRSNIVAFFITQNTSIMKITLRYMEISYYNGTRRVIFKT